MDKTTIEIILLSFILLLVLSLQFFNLYRAMRGGPTPYPRGRTIHSSGASLRRSNEYLTQQMKWLQTIPWDAGQRIDPEAAWAAYNQGIAVLSAAEGDHSRFKEAIGYFLECPPALAYSGKAGIIRRLTYIGGIDTLPVGIREAGKVTSLAIKADPSCADAWIERVFVFSNLYDWQYRQIARYALKKARQIHPNHPRLALATSSYLKFSRKYAQRETALIQAIKDVPTDPERMSAYDSLGMFYIQQEQLEKAIATYQEMLVQFPAGSAWTFHNYSLVLRDAGRLQEAYEMSNQALTFFEFQNARKVNNDLKKRLGIPAG